MRSRLSLVLPFASSLTLLSSLAFAEPPTDPWLGRDKALHFGASLTLAGGSYALSVLVFDPMADRAAIGTAVALGCGLAKEGLDVAGYGTPSLRDFAWDVAGTLVGVGVSLSVDWAAHRPWPAAPH